MTRTFLLNEADGTVRSSKYKTIGTEPHRPNVSLDRFLWMGFTLFGTAHGHGISLGFLFYIIIVI